MGVSHRHRGAMFSSIEAVAGNGLLNRRALLGRGVVPAGAARAAPLGSLTDAAAEPLTDTPLIDTPWSLEPGGTIEPYQRRSSGRERCAD